MSKVILIQVQKRLFSQMEWLNIPNLHDNLCHVFLWYFLSLIGYWSPLISIDQHWVALRKIEKHSEVWIGINILDQCQRESRAPIACLYQDMLDQSPMLINGDQYRSDFRNWSKMWLKWPAFFDPSLIDIDWHWALIHHVLIKKALSSLQ